MSGIMTGRLLNNRYQITERVGIGGMAEVYRAQDNVLGRMVAVKVMLPQYAEDATFRQRFRQEAASAANLSSPYIVNVYDWGHDDDTYYIVMEFVRGSDLKTAITQRGAINQHKVAEIGSQVCQALSVAHNMDIIHRDIKPQNIMVQPDGNVKVMDFGIARAKNSVMAKTSAVLGTAHYISPEQAQGKELTAASDIYSLGIVLYEAATGKLPFDGPDAVSVAMKQVQESPVPPSDINPDIDYDLESIILKALEKNPANRFATAVEMRQALNDYLSGRPVNINGFGSAQTQVISNVVPPVAPIYNTESTSVMPVVDNNGNTGNDGGGSYLNNRNGSNKGPGKKAAIIAIVAVAAVVIIAAIAFSMMNSGNDNATVPDVTGKTLSEATTLIEDAGFRVGTVDHVYSDTVPADSVVSQDPKAGEERAKGSRISLQLSQGAETIEVPDLTDMTANEARQALRDKGLNYEAGAAEHSDTIEENHVARQDPAAGTKVARNTVVTYYLSAGTDGERIPDVKGMTEGAAITTLNNAGFLVSTEYQSSDSVPQGNVISQSPEADSRAKINSTVHLVISTGNQTYTVSASAGPGGSVSPGSVEVNAGGSATFNYYANDGYEAVGANDTYGDTYPVSGTSGTFTISGVTANTVITVSFAAVDSGGNQGGETT